MKDRRAQAAALGELILGDLVTAGVPVTSRWAEFAEAVGMFALAKGKMEHVASVGVLVYAAARLDPGPEEEIAL